MYQLLIVQFIGPEIWELENKQTENMAMIYVQIYLWSCRSVDSYAVLWLQNEGSSLALHKIAMREERA